MQQPLPGGCHGIDSLLVYPSVDLHHALAAK
jgi:hypothetical protein